MVNVRKNGSYLFIYFCLCFYLMTKHIYIYTDTTTTTIPRGNITILRLYPWSYLVDTTLTVSLSFKDHWSHDLHDLMERPFNLLRYILLDADPAAVALMKLMNLTTR